MFIGLGVFDIPESNQFYFFSDFRIKWVRRDQLVIAIAVIGI